MDLNRRASLSTVILVRDADTPPRPVPSWRPGHFVWADGRTKVVLLGGVGTRSGDGERSFSGVISYLAQHGGYHRSRDFFEASYAGGERDGVWQPAPYNPVDTRKPLIDIAEAVAGSLDWYRDRLAPDTRLVALGYSLGGVAMIDGATLAMARDRDGWQGRLAAVVALAAPVHGCSVGQLVNWAWLVTGEPDGLGAAGRDLDARWRDAEEQSRLARRAAFLRSAGVRVLTLVDPDDTVVRPEEGLLPAPGESARELQIAATVRRPGSLGHGALLDEPSVWRRVFALAGPQQRDASHTQSATPDQIEEELAQIKARLRAQGRLR